MFPLSSNKSTCYTENKQTFNSQFNFDVKFVQQPIMCEMKAQGKQTDVEDLDWRGQIQDGVLKG